MSDKITQIDYLEARAAIADLVHGYALNIRTGRSDDCIKLFTADALFEVREAPLGSQGPGRTRAKLEGHTAILSYLSRATTSGSRVCPMIHNLIIRVNGTEATGNSVMETLVWPSGQKLIGAYEDCFRYERNWLFSARIFTILGEFGPG